MAWTFFVYEQRPHRKSALGPNPVNIQLFNPCPLYFFYFYHKTYCLAPAVFVRIATCQGYSPNSVSLSRSRPVWPRPSIAWPNRRPHCELHLSIVNFKSVSFNLPFRIKGIHQLTVYVDLISQRQRDKHKRVDILLLLYKDVLYQSKPNCTKMF